MTKSAKAQKVWVEEKPAKGSKVTERHKALIQAV
jgi:hypothetical protein